MAYQDNPNTPNTPNNPETGAANIWLQPIAAPSILGFFGFAGAAFMVGAHLAHWYGTYTSGVYLFPFVAIFGGLAQFAAGMWAYKARDGLATAMHGLWGSFWMAYGILMVTFMVGHFAPPTGAWPEMGFWFIVLAAITWAGMFAATGQGLMYTLILLFLASAASAGAAASFLGSVTGQIVAGWLLVISSGFAWYFSSALMINEAYGRELWGIRKSRHVKEMPPVVIGAGEPGVIRGQA